MLLRYRLSWLLGATLLPACFLNLKVPTSAVVSCTSNRQCPSEQRCLVEFRRCVASGSEDSTAPDIDDVELSPGSGALGGVFTLQFTVAEPLLESPLVETTFAGGSYPWTLSVTSNADGGIQYRYAYQHEASHGSEDATVFVTLADTVGNTQRISAGTITIDAQGPTMNPALLAVVSSPPGFPDLLKGNIGNTEANATIELFSDELLTTKVGSSFSLPDGSFPPLSLGDNYINEATGEQAGQATYYLRATDVLGNPGEAYPVTTAIEPPVLSDAAVAWEFTSSAGTIRTATSTLSAGRVFTVTLTSNASLKQAPVLSIEGTDLVSTCSIDGQVAQQYHCSIEPTGSEAESVDLAIAVTAVGAEGENIAKRSAGTVRFDFTPSAPVSEDVYVEQNPVGEADRVILPPGTAAPNAILVFFHTQTTQDQFGNTMCDIVNDAVITADETGASTFSIGDNGADIQAGATFSIRQIGSNGSDPCLGCGFCTNSRTLSNDVTPPTIELLASPPAISDTEVTLELTSNDDPANPHEPVDVTCSLDGAPFSTCPATLTGLSAGPHTVVIRALDALLNAAPDQTLTWVTLQRSTLVDAPRYAGLSDAALILDADGNSHIFVGGDKLYHHFEDTGVFYTEIVTPAGGPIDTVTARRFGDVLYVAYNRPINQSANVGVDLATFENDMWTVEKVTRYIGRQRSFDLAISPTGEPVIVHQRCRGATQNSCFVNGSNVHDFALQVTTKTPTGWTEPQTLPGNHRSLEPRIEVTPLNKVIVSFHSTTSSRYFTQVRTANTWEDAVSVEAISSPNLQNGTLLTAHPRMMLLGELPVLSFKPGTNSNFAAYVGLLSGSFSFRNLANQSPPAIATLGGEIYAAFPDGTVHRRGPSPQFTWSNAGITIPNSNEVEGVSLAVTGVGDVASATFRLATQRSATVAPRGTITNHTHHAVTDTTTAAGPAAGITSAVTLKGAAVPSAVFSTGNGEVKLTSHDELAGWSSPETVYSGIPLSALELAAVQSGSEKFVVRSAATDFSYIALHLEHYTNGAWTTLTDVSSFGVTSTKPRLALTASAAPILVHDGVSGSERLEMRVWTGAAFSDSTTLHTFSFGGDLSSLALIGDVAGETWVVYGVQSSREVRLIRFDPSAQNFTNSTCEGCADTLVLDEINFPQVSAGKTPSGAPVIWLADNDSSTLRELVWNGSAWDDTSLSDDMSLEVFDSSTQTFTPRATTCFFSEPAVVTYDAEGRRTLGLHQSCQATGSASHYALYNENETGTFVGRVVDEYASRPGEAIGSLSVWARANGLGVMAWIDTVTEQVRSIREEQARP